LLDPELKRKRGGGEGGGNGGGVIYWYDVSDIFDEWRFITKKFKIVLGLLRTLRMCDRKKREGKREKRGEQCTCQPAAHAFEGRCQLGPLTLVERRKG